MAAAIKETTAKITLDLETGTQTISPLLENISDESAYTIGTEIGKLQESPTEAVVLVITDVIADGE